MLWSQDLRVGQEKESCIGFTQVLQTQVLSIKQVDEPCIGVNIRELNKELCTE